MLVSDQIISQKYSYKANHPYFKIRIDLDSTLSCMHSNNNKKRGLLRATSEAFFLTFGRKIAKKLLDSTSVPVFYLFILRGIDSAKLSR